MGRAVRYSELMRLAIKPDLRDPSFLKLVASGLLCGENYRKKTEQGVQSSLAATYVWLYETCRLAQEQHGDQWREQLFDALFHESRLPKEDKSLKWWLLGLSEKTAKNIDIFSDPNEARKFLDSQIAGARGYLEKAQSPLSEDELWVMLMAGHATLTIRGSSKSQTGKRFEHAFLTALFSVLGLVPEDDFRVSVDNDGEYDRQHDAEIFGNRKRYQVDLGLIADGNPEVISDKITRIGRDGMVICDKISPSSNAWDVARNNGVALVMIRNGNPLSDVHQYLIERGSERITTKLADTPPINRDDICHRVFSLPDQYFVPEE